MPSRNTRIPMIAQAAAGTFTRWNEALGALDTILCEDTTITVAGSDVLLTPTQSLRNMGLTFDGTPGADRDVDVLVLLSTRAPPKRWWLIRNEIDVDDEVTLRVRLDLTPTFSSVIIQPGFGKWLAYFDGTEQVHMGLAQGSNRHPTRDGASTEDTLSMEVDEFRDRTLSGNTTLTFGSARKGSYYFEVDSAAGGHTLTLSGATIIQGTYNTDGTINHIKATSIQGVGDGGSKWIAEIFQE